MRSRFPLWLANIYACKKTRTRSCRVLERCFHVCWPVGGAACVLCLASVLVLQESDCVVEQPHVVGLLKDNVVVALLGIGPAFVFRLCVLRVIDPARKRYRQAYTRSDRQTWTHKHTQTNYMHTHTHTHTHIQQNISKGGTKIRAALTEYQMHIYIYIYIYIYMHTHICVYMYICI